MQQKQTKWKLRQAEYAGAIEFIKQELTKKAQADEFPKQDGKYLLEKARDQIKQLIRQYFVKKSGDESLVPKDFPSNAQYWAISRQLSGQGFLESVKTDKSGFYICLGDTVDPTPEPHDNVPSINRSELTSIGNYIIGSITREKETFLTEDDTGGYYLSEGRETIAKLVRQYFEETGRNDVIEKYPLGIFPSSFQIHRVLNYFYDKKFIWRTGTTKESKYYVNLLKEEEPALKKASRTVDEVIDKLTETIKELGDEEERKKKVIAAKKEINLIFDQVKSDTAKAQEEIEKLRVSTKEKLVGAFKTANEERKKTQKTLRRKTFDALGFSQKVFSGISEGLGKIRDKLEDDDK